MGRFGPRWGLRSWLPLRGRDVRPELAEPGCAGGCCSLRAARRTGDDSREALGEGTRDVGADEVGAVLLRRGPEMREGVDCDFGFDGGGGVCAGVEVDDAAACSSLADEEAPGAPGPSASSVGLSIAQAGRQMRERGVQRRGQWGSDM